MGTFSFFPAKNLGALGDGGAVVCQDEAMRETLRILRNHGGATMYHYEKIGGNFRLDALQAAFLSTKLPHLAQWETQRRQNASLYDARFAALPGIKTPVVGPGCHHVYNQYVLRFTDGSRDQAQAQLKEQGVASAIYYPLCLHLQTCFADLGGKEGDFPQAERASREVLAIPVLTDRPEEVIKAVEATR
jgi:dTDP-4-amino-4,6-dideoxygalactose transaminase